MIIKSTSRKDTNFSQLVEYIHKEAGRNSISDAHEFSYLHNMNASPKELDSISKAFEENDQYRKKRKNGVAMYHDIISFAPEDSQALLKDPNILQEIARTYIHARCPDAMAVAKVHYDQDHVHIHVMISGTIREGSKVQRISKAEFKQIKQDLQLYRKQNFPELEHSYIKDVKERQNQDIEQRQSDAERRFEEREKQSDKHYVSKILEEALSLDLGGKRFTTFLKEHDIQVYSRGGNIAGVMFKGRKYRFSTIMRGSPDTVKRLVGLCLEEQRNARRKKTLNRVQQERNNPDKEQKR